MPTLADTLALALKQQASQRGRDWLASIPQAVQPAGPPDMTVPGSAENDYNTSYGNLLGSQLIAPESGLSAFYKSDYPPSAEQQRQEMAQMEMIKELGRLKNQPAPTSTPTPMPGWAK